VEVVSMDVSVGYDIELPPEPPKEAPMFEGLEGKAVAERALDLAELYTWGWGLGGAIRTAILRTHGVGIAQALLILEGYGRDVEDLACRLAQHRWRVSLDDYRPPDEPSSWTPKAVQEWIEEWSGHKVSVTAEKHWREWEVSITMGGQSAHSWRAKSRKAGLQEIVGYDLLWRELLRLDVEQSGWEEPSPEALRARQSDAGRARVQAREVEWERVWDAHHVAVAAWEAARHTKAQEWVAQSAELLGYLKSSPNLRTLYDLKAVLPDGWKAHSHNCTNSFAGTTTRRISYSVAAPSGFSWSNYEKEGASESLEMLVKSVQYHAEQKAERYTQDQDKGYHTPYATAPKPGTPPPTPAHIYL